MDILIHSPDGRQHQLKKGISGGEALASLPMYSHLFSDPPLGDTPVGIVFDNEIRCLTGPLMSDGTIAPILLKDPEGVRIYRRTLNFLLAMASLRCFPDRRLIIGHSIGDSMFFSYRGSNQVEERDLQELQIILAKLIEEGPAIEQKLVKHQQFEQYFQRNFRENSLLLLQHYTDAMISAYQCAEYMDLDFGPLLPSASLAKNYEIRRHREGFVLVYPPGENIEDKPQFADIRVLSRTYSEYHRWAEILEVDTVGKLNSQVEKKQIREFIWVAEALQNQKLAAIAHLIAERDTIPRLVLIAGPSSSGKTTFAKRLNIYLRSLGFKPLTLSLDDYFVSRDRTPLDEEGNYDFESLHAIDVDLLNKQLVNIIAGEAVEIPSFNFKTGRSEYKGRTLQLSPDGVLIIEGIHGLNDALTPLIPEEQKYKIYISALTQINLDEANRISTTDNRLIRRIVRDYRYRGYSAGETLMRWPSVRRGEERNIFPFQDRADSAFNSALDYELAVLKQQAESVLRQIKPGSEHYGEARRLIKILQSFLPVPRDFVPDNSILREFVGGSVFQY